MANANYTQQPINDRAAQYNNPSFAPQPVAGELSEGLHTYGGLTGQKAPDTYSTVAEQINALAAQIHRGEGGAQGSSYGQRANTPVPAAAPVAPVAPVAPAPAPKNDGTVGALSIDPMQAAARAALNANQQDNAKKLSAGTISKTASLAPSASTSSNPNALASSNLVTGGGSGGSNNQAADEGKFRSQMWNSNFANALSNAGTAGQIA